MILTKEYMLLFTGVVVFGVTISGLMLTSDSADTKCSIVEIITVDLGDDTFYVEIQFQNTGKSDISNYTYFIRGGGGTLSGTSYYDELVSPGDIMDNDFNIEDETYETIQIGVRVENNNALVNCSEKIEL